MHAVSSDTQGGQPMFDYFASAEPEVPLPPDQPVWADLVNDDEPDDGDRYDPDSHDITSTLVDWMDSWKADARDASRELAARRWL